MWEYSVLHQGRSGELLEEMEEGKVMARLEHWKRHPMKGTAERLEGSALQWNPFI